MSLWNFLLIVAILFCYCSFQKYYNTSISMTPDEWDVEFNQERDTFQICNVIHYIWKYKGNFKEALQYFF